MGIRISASVYISVRHAFAASGGKPHVQNGNSDGNTIRIIRITRMPSSNSWRERDRDLDKSIASFYQVRLTTAPRVVEFV